MTAAGAAGGAALGVSYARFSTDRQSSVQDQHRVNESLASGHGVRLLKTFSDEAQARSLSERCGPNDLLEFLREHDEVRYIVVNELERITGDLRQRVVLADTRRSSTLRSSPRTALSIPSTRSISRGGR